MKRFHITDSGLAAPCNASLKACPRGGYSDHFDTAQEAAVEGQRRRTAAEREKRKASGSVTMRERPAETPEATLTLAEAEAMALNLMSEHGIVAAFRFNNSSRTAGITKFRWGKVQAIELSARWVRVHSPERVKDTILHELAHAKAGHEAGHGPAWKAQAEQLGAAPQACFEADQDERDNVYPWKSTCRECGATGHVGSAPRRVSSCGRCSDGAGWHPSRLLQWHKDGQPVDHLDMPPSYRREYYALRNSEKWREVFDQLDAQRLEGAAQVPESDTGYVIGDDGGCHYYGSWRGNGQPSEPEPRTERAKKELDPAMIEALKLKYLKKFKVPFDESGLSIPELLQMAQNGELG